MRFVRFGVAALLAVTGLVAGATVRGPTASASSSSSSCGVVTTEHGAAVGDGLRGVTAVPDTDEAYAVGTRSSDPQGSTSRNVVMHDDGTSWTELAGVPNAGAATNVLNDVGADNPTDIWAVGDSDGHATAMRYDGSTWTSAPVTEPAGATASSLATVLVVSSTDVWAGGTWKDAGGQTRPLLAHFTSHWSVVGPPSFDNGSYGQVRDITASPLGDVWVIEEHHLLRWDGSSWHDRAIPQLPYFGSDGSGFSFPRTVVVLSRNDIWVAGSDEPTELDAGPAIVIWHWDGQRWTFGHEPRQETPGIYQARITDLVQTTAGDLYAVGREYTGNWTGGNTDWTTVGRAQPLLLRYNGHGWRALPTPGSLPDHVVTEKAAMTPAGLLFVGNVDNKDGFVYRMCGAFASTSVPAGGAASIGPNDVDDEQPLNVAVLLPPTTSGNVAARDLYTLPAAVDVTLPSGLAEKHPARLVFTIDASRFLGSDPVAAVWRGPSRVAACASAEASPDACLVSDDVGSDGDHTVTVRTTTGGTWSVAQRPVTATFVVHKRQNPRVLITLDREVPSIDGHVYLPGHATCRDDADAIVDCATGPVRSIYAPQENGCAGCPEKVGLVSLPDANNVRTSRIWIYTTATRVQDDFPLVDYSWRKVNKRANYFPYRPFYITEDEPGATATYQFAGTSVDLYTVTGPRQGIADVFVDGQSVCSCDQYDATVHRGVVRSFTGFSSGGHTVQIRVTGDKNPASRGTFVSIEGLASADYFDYPVYAPDDPLARFSWAREASSLAADGLVSRDHNPGAAVGLTFQGSAVQVYLLAGPDGGRVKVESDDSASIVDTYARRPQIRSVTVPGSTPKGVARITLTLLARHNPRSTDHVLAIDRMHVLRRGVE